jgi:hypothetical protein
MGLISLCLTTVNVISIFIMAYLVLKIKEVAPYSSMSASTRRFWKEDIKIARDYNKTESEGQNTLGEEFLREWAAMTGLDEKELMSDRPESKVAQLQTLQDMLRDVESDEVFRSIVRSTQGNEISIEGRRHSLYPPGMSTLPLDGDRRGSTIHSTGTGARRGSTVLQASMARRTSAFCLKVPEATGPDAMQRRRSSAMLRKSLQATDHLPYSVWPQARPRSDSRFTVTPVTEPVNIRVRRASKAPRLPSTSESDFRD